MKAILFLVLAAGCGTQGTQTKAVFLSDDAQPFAGAIRSYSSDFNARLGCEAIKFVADDGALEIKWSTEAEMAAHFSEVAKRGGLADGEEVEHWSPTADWASTRVWFALDYEGATPEDVGKAWLTYVGWSSGLSMGTDPNEVMYPHPTRSADPVGSLIKTFGGLQAARGFKCP